MPQYITAAEVQTRLLGKVAFTNDEADQNAVSSGFLEQLIDEAEAEVEHLLSRRYFIPFQRVDDAPFSDLPQVSKTQIKMLCRLEACKRVLAHDFGRGSAAEGENYYKSLHADFERVLQRHLAIKEGQFNQFLYPPLPDLKIAYTNTADDGFAGQIFVTGDNLGGAAPGQMPSPGESWWNGVPPYAEQG